MNVTLLHINFDVFYQVMYFILFRAKNLAYEELCKSREGNDKFTERGMQTFNNALKNKDIQADKVRRSDCFIY